MFFVCLCVHVQFRRPRLTAQLPAELLADGRLQEAWVAVFLHQGVDLAPGKVETGAAWVFQVLHSDGFSLMVKIDLIN